MTPAQWNEYERQAQVIERHKKWKEQQKQSATVKFLNMVLDAISFLSYRLKKSICVCS
jgi:hypothetical protein